MRIFKSGLIFIALFITALAFSACARGGSQSVAVSGKAADFTLENVNGGEITLSHELKDRKAVLVFFATWCPYCVEEVPRVNAFYARNRKRVAVIGIDIQESRARVRRFIQKKGVSYPVALDTDGSVARRYGVRGIPTVIAVGREGKILYRGHGVTEMEQKIKF